MTGLLLHMHNKHVKHSLSRARSGLVGLACLRGLTCIESIAQVTNISLLASLGLLMAFANTNLPLLMSPLLLVLI